MSASTTDSDVASRQAEPGAAETDPLEPALGVRSGKATAKPRTRRPRPTFEDGSLTRVFKFPSKTYPRSSYYVTGDEIIIRVKKARKRWKLVVPKKRLVSYRTNRWFAKPRWVEIEITYTQAVKLKLVEPRPHIAPDVSDTASSSPAAAHMARPETPSPNHEAAPQVIVDPGNVCEANVTACSEAPRDAELSDGSDTDAADEAMTISEEEEEPGDEALEEWDEATADEIAAEPPPAALDEPIPDEAERGAAGAAPAGKPEVTDMVGMTEVEAPEVGPAAVPAAAPEAEAAPTVAAVPESQSESVSASGLKALPLEPAPSSQSAGSSPAGDNALPIRLPVASSITVIPRLAQTPIQESIAPPHAARRHTPPRSETPGIRRFDARLWATTLTLAAVAASWVAFEEMRGGVRPDDIACTSSDVASSCAAPIMTGSIEPAAPSLSAGEAVQAPAEPAPTVEGLAALIPPQAAIGESASVAAEDELPAAAVAAVAIDAARTPDVLAPPDTTVLARTDGAALADAAPSRANLSPAQTARTVQAPWQCTEMAKPAAQVTIQFEFASSSLDRTAVATLDSLAARLLPCTAALITLEGHTDSDGDPARNQALSVRRADEVRAHLQNAGIPAARLASVGFGPARPLTPNTSAENKRANRRVVISVDVHQ